jgi:signal peptidase II
MTDKRHLAPLVGGIAALTAIDLASKRWAVAALSDAPIKLPGPVDLQLTYNSGTAFGLFSNVPTILLSIVTFAFLVVVLNMWRTQRAPTIPVVLIVAGGLANIIDRLEAGSVVDILHTGWWPNFNLADTFITIGVAWWIITTLTSTNTIDDPTDRATVALGDRP